MNPRAAARELLKSLNAPAWALSVAVVFRDGAASLQISIDPKYRLPLPIPESFGGYPVAVQVRTITKAQISN